MANLFLSFPISSVADTKLWRCGGGGGGKWNMPIFRNERQAECLCRKSICGMNGHVGAIEGVGVLYLRIIGGEYVC